MAELLGDWRRNGSRQGAGDLAAAVRLCVLDGRLLPGTRLPAEREVAESLGVSRTLIGSALDRLRSEGLVASRQGAGSWITAPEAEAFEPAGADLDLIDLTRAAPPAVPGLLGAMDAARSTLTPELLDTGYLVRGLPILRERIARRYTERGLPTDPDQIVVTGGAQNAFAIVLRALTSPGDRVLLEQPCYPNTPEAIRAASILPVVVAVDPEVGWDVTGIEAALRQAGPRLAYFVVDFHNPTGLRMPVEQREHLAAVLANTRTLAVVDETVAELGLEEDGEPVPPLAAFAGDWAITIGSAAKSHWGGLRLGWLRASEELVGRIVSARHSLDLGSPVFEQLVLAELLAADHILSRRRAVIRPRRDALVAAVREHCPEWTFRIPEGGLSLWCKLPEPMSTRLSVAAVNHGVRIVPGARFGVHGGLERWLRLPYTQEADRLDEAVRRLGLAASALRPAPRVTESTVT
ncbi:GntR family transcriptional regulator [Prauserella marina]|uniref:MocR-like transcription factor YczR n=1 Tax=Prauserella marina TaxID=530584 RepID=UPI000B872257|nr:PLP-dependent aminotransferase family protein [Prauserella marina]ASR33911.1 GntR family transcriptional regulator [Prauserella marina]